MKYILVLVALITISTQLHTSSFWTKKGINVKDQVLEQIYPEAINISTQCATVLLNTDPYHYNGVVRSGYLSVGKGNSVLGFTFYGK